MKKITILALHLGFGGIEKYISSLCKMLEENYEIEIISTYKVLDKPAFEFSEKVNIQYLINDKPYKKEMKDAFNEKRVLKGTNYFIKNLVLLNRRKKSNIKAIKNIDSDIIITTRDFHNRLVGKYAKKNIKKIATEHNYHNNDNKYIIKLVNSIRNFDYFVVVSNELKYFYKDKIGNTKCIFIPNVIDKVYDDPKYNKNHNLVSVGRLSSEKGFLDLLDIIKIVAKTIPDVRLDLIGDGEQKEILENKINFLDLKKNVIMHGFLNQDQIEKIIVNDSIYVMASFTESFGLVLIEAMSYGLPCVAFDTASGAREIITNKDFLIKDRNNDEFAKFIIELFKNPSNIEKQGKANYYYCRKYLLRNVKAEWQKLLK